MMLNKLWSCGSNVYMYKKSSLPSLVFHAFGIISAIHVLHEILSNGGVNLYMDQNLQKYSNGKI